MCRFGRNILLIVVFLWCQASFALYDEEFWHRLPYVVIESENGVLPTYTVLEHPEGKVGCTIIDNDYVFGRMKVCTRDSLYYDSGDRGMKFRIRGNTSATSFFKPYKVKLSKKADLLGLGYKDKEWNLLYAGGGVLNFAIGKMIGDIMGMEWQPEYMFVPLFINGEYKGLYIFTETVKKDKHRVNIADDGYLIENDYYFWAEDVYFKTARMHHRFAYTFKYPNSEDASDSVIASIRSDVIEYEDAVYNHTMLSSIADIESLVSWVMSHDLLGTRDALGSNMFMYRKSSADGEKIKFGPLWDFDSIMKEEEWASQRRRYMWYINEAAKDGGFNAVYRRKWNELKETLYEEICSHLDSIAYNGNYLNDALLYANTDAESLYDAVGRAKEWFRRKIDFIDENLYKVPYIVSVEYFAINGAKVEISGDLPSGLYIRVAIFSDGTKEGKLMYVR